MKYGYFVWIDEEDRKVKITDERKTLGEFIQEDTPEDFDKKWNENTWCVPEIDEAREIRTKVAEKLAGPHGRNTGLFGVSGPAIGDF